MKQKQEQAEIVNLKSGREFVVISGKVYPLLHSAEISFIFNCMTFAVSQLMPEVLEENGGLADSEGNVIEMEAYIENMKALFSVEPYANRNFLACLTVDFQTMIGIARQLEIERNKSQSKIISIN